MVRSQRRTKSAASPSRQDDTRSRSVAVYVLIGIAYGMALDIIAFMAAGFGHGTYVPLTVFGAPFSFAGPLVALVYTPVFWTLVAVLLAYARSVRARWVLVVLICGHLASLPWLLTDSEVVDSVYGSAFRRTAPGIIVAAGVAYAIGLLTVLGVLTYRFVQRRVRFTLRTLLILFGCVALTIGSGSTILHRFQRDAAILERMHGCRPQPSYRFGEVHSLSFGSTVATSDMAAIHGLRGLARLDLRGHHEIGDEHLAHLGHMANLRDLVLTDCGITDEGVLHLLGLTRLESLMLDETKIGDRGAAQLSRLRQLRLLSIENTQVTPPGLAMLHESLPKATIRGGCP